MPAKIFFCLFFLYHHYAASQEQQHNSTEFGNAAYISQSQLHQYLSFLSSDILQGRDTPSRGLDIAANFLAAHLFQWGLKGAGDSLPDGKGDRTFFQNMALLRSKINPAKTTITINGKKFSFGKDFISTPVATSITAPLAYVKNGVIVKEKNINPYKGIDVKGKIVVIQGGLPKGVTFGDLVGKKGVDYDTPPNFAMNNGAAAVIVIPTAKALAHWKEGEKNYVEKGEITVLKFIGLDKQPVVSITASEELISALFEKENTGVSSMWKKSSADSVPSFVFSSATQVTLAISTDDDTVNTQNVVAVLEGSDPKLKNEYVAFSAHYDHVGIGVSVDGDSIYNGADDNGSGTAALLACAEAYAKGEKPKRSLLFIWHAAEEKGLLGSKYFVRYPTVPLENIITLINADMIGRSKPDSGVDAFNDDLTLRNEVFVIGSDMISTEVGRLNEEVNKSFLNLKLNYKFDNPLHPLKLYYRSDHYNYAKNNIPIIFYFDGLHEDYHQVSDEIEKIDFEKLTNVAKTIFAVGWRLANLPQRPKVDKNLYKELFD